MVFGRADGDFAASYDLKSSDIVDGNTAASLLGLRALDALGIGVGPVGDFNGDGIADVWVSKTIPLFVALTRPTICPLNSLVILGLWSLGFRVKHASVGKWIARYILYLDLGGQELCRGCFSLAEG